jgi:hypothetical protein
MQNLPNLDRGPGYLSGIVPGYGLDGSEIEFRWGEILHPSRSTLGPTQSSIQWEPDFYRG